MYQYEEIREIIEKEIKNNEILAVKPPNQLYQPIQYILSIGGKRIRPALVLMAYNLFKDTISEAIKPALAMEVFHNFTLLHDDIMDESALRRGNPTVHKKWNDNVAILSGDAMAILSYQLLLQNNSSRLKDLLEVFNKVAVEVCEGQQYDMDFENIDEVPYDDYLRMIELKTSVLIAGSLKIGALLAEASDEDANALYEFGRNIGLAFQIQDDYLDVYGNPDQFQKFIGGDIVANKKTFLLIKALELANPQQKSQIFSLLSNEKIEPQAKVDEMKAIYDELAIEKITKDSQDQMFQAALAALNKVGVDEERKEILNKFALKLFKRSY